MEHSSLTEMSVYAIKQISRESVLGLYHHFLLGCSERGSQHEKRIGHFLYRTFFTSQSCILPITVGYGTTHLKRNSDLSLSLTVFNSVSYP